MIADPRVLRTLPQEERVQGLVEAFKHGAILDIEYYDQLRADTELLLDADPLAARAAVVGSIRLKADVVAKDELEGGYRQILNFGHTLGHALEAASEYVIGHGTAVAAGMLLEAELGERLGVTAAGTREALSLGLSGLGFQLDSLSGLDVEAVMVFLGSDKKARFGRPRYVLLRRLGLVDDAEGWSREVPDALVREVLGELS